VADDDDDSGGSSGGKGSQNSGAECDGSLFSGRGRSCGFPPPARPGRCQPSPRPAVEEARWAGSPGGLIEQCVRMEDAVEDSKEIHSVGSKCRGLGSGPPRGSWFPCSQRPPILCSWAGSLGRIAAWASVCPSRLPPSRPRSSSSPLGFQPAVHWPLHAYLRCSSVRMKRAKFVPLSNPPPSLANRAG